ncbi:DUF2510 domain-containing protein [Nocardioides humilatus]
MPPGWYPDPTTPGARRWWTGTIWGPPPLPAPSSPPKPGVTVRIGSQSSTTSGLAGIPRQWWIVGSAVGIPVVLLCGALVILLLIGASGSGRDQRIREACEADARDVGGTQQMRRDYVRDCIEYCKSMENDTTFGPCV